ncbi:unnamed protein product, partial [Ectocarpus fasciculatus]
GSVSSEELRFFDGGGGCVFNAGFSPSFAPDYSWTQSKLVLEGDQRCFERDVRWEEMVHVDQGAAAGLF